ncbi:MAG: Ig-like domain-containing protein [Phycisphaerae bacterium]
MYNYQLTYETGAIFDEVTIDVAATSKQLSLNYDHWYWRLHATDKAGNQSGVSTEYDFTLVEPKILAIRFEDAAGNELADDLTKNAGDTVYVEIDTQMMRGTNATVYLFEDDGFWGSDDQLGPLTISIPTGSDTGRVAWTVPWNTDSDGSDVFPEYRFWRSTGTLETMHTRLLNVSETGAPTLTGAPDLAAGSDTGYSNTDNITKDDTPTFTWTAATDSQSGIGKYEYRLDSGSWTDIGSVTTYTLPTVSGQGSHTFYVRAKDRVGTPSGEISLPWTLDTVAPSVPAPSSPADGVSLGTLTPTLQWTTSTDTGGSGVYNYQLTYETASLFDEVTIDVAGTSKQVTLREDLWYWRVAATDKAGNQSNDSSERQVRIQMPIIGNLSVVATQQDGTPVSGAQVVLYRQDTPGHWIEDSRKTTNAAGVAPSWTGLDAGGYNLEVYYNGEYWACAWDQQNGAAVVSKNQTTSLSLHRNEPYAFDFQAKDEATTVTGGTVTIGTPVTYEVSLRNSSPVARSVRVLLWADRDKAGPYDFAATSDIQTLVANGGTGVFTFTDTVGEAGTHYRQIEVQTLVNEVWVKSDSWPWGMAVKTGQDINPPDVVTGLTAEGGVSSNHLQWTNPGNRDFAGVIVVRRTGQAASGKPANGATCTVGATFGSGTVVYVGNGTSLADTGLTNGTTYYYSVYSFDASRNYQTAVVEHATPGYPKTTIFEAIDFSTGVASEIKTFISGLAGVAWDKITDYVTDRFEFLPDVTAGFKFGFEVSGLAGEGAHIDIASAGVEVSVAYSFAERSWTISRGFSLDFVGDKLSLAGEEYLELPTDAAEPITVGIGLTGEYSLLSPPEIKVGINKALSATLSYSDQIKSSLSVAVETDMTRQDFLLRTGQSSLSSAVLDCFGLETSSWTEWVGDRLGSVTPFGVPILSALGIGDDPLAILSSSVLDGSTLHASVEAAASREMSLKVNAGLGLGLGVGVSTTVYVGAFAEIDMGVLTVWDQDFSLASLKPVDDVGDTATTASPICAATPYTRGIARNDKDVFVIDAAEGQRQELVVTPGSTGQFVVAIRDSEQRLISQSTVFSSVGSVTVPFTATDAGQYYVSIEGTSRTSSGDYTLQWLPISVCSTFEQGFAGFSYDGNVTLAGTGSGSADFFARLREGSPASLSTVVTVPDITPTLTFDYRSIAAGDGDLMQVRVNGTPVWSQPIGAESADFASSPVIDLSAYAGQSVSLEFYLDSVGSSNAGFDVDNVALNGADSFVFCSPYGPAKVTLFDTTGTGLGDAAKNVVVKFGRDNSVSSITLVGSLPLTGVGVVIADATKVVAIKDSRKGPIGDLAFIASSGPIGTLSLKGGVAGHDLNGVSLGGLTLAADVDGDGITNDNTSIYVGAGLSNTFDIRGQVLADVVALGGLSSLRHTATLSDIDIVIGSSSDPKAVASLTLGQVTDVDVVSAMPVKSLSAVEWLDVDGNNDILRAPSIGSIVVAGRKANARAGITALAGRFDADMILSGIGVLAGKPALGSVTIAGDLDTALWDIQGSIGSVSVAGTSRNSLVRSSGDITSIKIGASDGSDFGAGVSYDLLQSDGHVAVGDTTNTPTGTIKTFTVAGWKILAGQPTPDFFIDSNISAKIGKLSLLNWDGLGGLFASAGSVKSIVYKDTADKNNNWVYPVPPLQVSDGPDAFVHLI